MSRLPLLLLYLCLAACAPYPRDAHDSSERAREAFRVGLSHDPPHVIASDARPRGNEVELIEALAADRELRVEWVVGNHDALMQALLDHRLHLVAGGHTDASPWRDVSWSRTYRLPDARGRPANRRLALPPGENAWQLSVDRFLHERTAPQ
ncbi:ABC transporter substrate-binding protein [Luteimonas sp. 100069]|uniref:transporter substrate-binding domain-containing protein n=1 Tax=Luteimonas sp. 100069 TaxID=2006109 RepID=UPI000F4DAB41|nr:ABC transporter substrate-binding protein [Luteimonas sp. 100069]RPD88788.1 ABC transporter substrate-binding protein [Luteimonas sp. 100069]